VRGSPRPGPTRARRRRRWVRAGPTELGTAVMSAMVHRAGRSARRRRGPRGRLRPARRGAASSPVRAIRRRRRARSRRPWRGRGRSERAGGGAASAPAWRSGTVRQGVLDLASGIRVRDAAREGAEPTGPIVRGGVWVSLMGSHARRRTTGTKGRRLPALPFGRPSIRRRRRSTRGTLPSSKCPSSPWRTPRSGAPEAAKRRRSHAERQRGGRRSRRAPPRENRRHQRGPQRSTTLRLDPSTSASRPGRVPSGTRRRAGAEGPLRVERRPPAPPAGARRVNSITTA
jgi:hypothetical protein